VQVALFSLVAAMLFADQNLLAPHLTAAGHDFNFTDAERDAKLGGVRADIFCCVCAVCCAVCNGSGLQPLGRP